MRLIDTAAAEPLARTSGTLALIRHATSRSPGEPGAPWLDTGLEALGGPAAVELWQVPGPVEDRIQGPFRVRAAGEVAFLAAVFPDREDLAPVAETLYRELYAAAAALGRPHLLRVWHYFPRIHARIGHDDRYRRFCTGRSKALTALGVATAALPAASLLGAEAPGLLCYALLAATPGTQIENPRQRSAFRYPARYGRDRPAFSRAVAKNWNGANQLYISGTASITGHASHHATTLEQLGETLANLEALLAAAHEHAGLHADGLRSIAPLKVYLRHGDDLAPVRDALAERLGAGHPVQYLRADVCRPELLVEIEGMAVSTAA
ncbi:MAG: hypothetical protein ACRES7_08415 [Gammaproteobacteria bacterium]